MKRIAAIHDISGIGKCSLTAALPIISSTGVECNPVPTAVLSTHTGEFYDYSYTDLSDSLDSYIRHWKSLDLKFDGIYSGYLGSIEQIHHVENFISDFSKDETITLVDPAMADHNKLYSGFDFEYVNEMKLLCHSADIITPNITEAYMLCGYDKVDYMKLDNVMAKIITLPKKYVIITDYSLNENKTGCIVLDNTKNKPTILETVRYPGVYYGTGDIFASVLISALVSSIDVAKAAQIATEFISKCIKKTFEEKTDTRYGVNFESNLPGLYQYFGGNFNELR